jgi:hypothetical protein
LLDPLGYDAGKKIKGRKWHILVDTLLRSIPYRNWQENRRPRGANRQYRILPRTNSTNPISSLGILHGGLLQGAPRFLAPARSQR